jgi:DNA-binding MarR family transcriptional regulator
MEAREGVSRDNLGFLLAKASQRWNELLYARFVEAGFGDVRPAYGSVLVPLFEEDGLRIGEIATRSRLSKQTMTTLVRLTERAGLTTRHQDPSDGRALRVELAERGRRLEPVVAAALAELDGLVAQAVGRRRATGLSDSLREISRLPDSRATAEAA